MNNCIACITEPVLPAVLQSIDSQTSRTVPKCSTVVFASLLPICGAAGAVCGGLGEEAPRHHHGPGLLLPDQHTYHHGCMYFTTLFILPSYTSTIMAV